MERVTKPLMAEIRGTIIVRRQPREAELQCESCGEKEDVILCNLEGDKKIIGIDQFLSQFIGKKVKITIVEVQ